jgi:hypothetical protein
VTKEALSIGDKALISRTQWFWARAKEKMRAWTPGPAKASYLTLNPRSRPRNGRGPEKTGQAPRRARNSQKQGQIGPSHQSRWYSSYRISLPIREKPKQVNQSRPRNGRGPEKTGQAPRRARNLGPQSKTFEQDPLTTRGPDRGIMPFLK